MLLYNIANKGAQRVLGHNMRPVNQLSVNGSEGPSPQSRGRAGPDLAEETVRQPELVRQKRPIALPPDFDGQRKALPTAAKPLMVWEDVRKPNAPQ